MLTEHLRRLRHAFGVATGRIPIPHSSADAQALGEQLIRHLTNLREFHMAAIDDLNATIEQVKTYVATLTSELASADQTTAIEAANTALKALLPAAAAAPEAGALDPNAPAA